MDKRSLYDTIAIRKLKSQDFDRYDGGNGRVDRCVDLFVRGDLRSGGSLIDFGGGIGDLGYALRDRFDRTIVVDISKDNLRAAASKGNRTVHHDVDVGSIVELGPSCIDVVTALDFIEHIVDPIGFARECARLLRPGGQVFVNTPNIQFWRHMEMLVRCGRFPHTSGDREVYHGGHLAFYTFSDLCEIFGTAGLNGWAQFNDEAGYENPPDQWLQSLEYPPRNRDEYVTACKRLGNPNLMFRCEK